MKNKGFIVTGLICSMSLGLLGCVPKIEVSQDIASVEIGQNIDYNKVFSTEDEAIIKLESEPIDTREIGKHQLTYSISINNKTIKKTCEIEVVDTTAPILEEKNTSIEFGTDIDLLDNSLVSVKDDGDTNPTIEVIQGTVDTNTAGEYTVVYEVSDCYGNKEDKEVVYRVMNKKYTTEELTEYAKRYCDDMIEQGYKINYEVDDFGTGISISYDPIDIKKLNSKLYYTLYFDVTLDDTVDTPVTMAVVTAPCSQDIYDETYHVYLKGGDNQIDLSDNDVQTGNWDYTGSAFYTLIVGMIATNENKENIESILNLNYS